MASTYKVHKRPIADNSDDEPAPIQQQNKATSSGESCGNEMLTICIVQCGVNMGYQYVSTIMREHKLDERGLFTGNMKDTNEDMQLLSKINACFKHVSDGNNKFVPRTIFFDTDRSSIDRVRESRLSRVFASNPQHLMDGGYCDSCALYPIGYNQGMDVIHETMDVVRAEVESFDSFQGSQLIHSIDGGCGSGFASLLLHKLGDEYPKKIRMSHVCWSDLQGRTASYGPHNLTLAAYNRVLAVDQLIEHCHLNTVLNNGLLLQHSMRARQHINAHNVHVTYADMNAMAALVLGGITSPLRFVHEPQIADSLKKMNAFFTVFPRLHFLNVCHAPFISAAVAAGTKCQDNDILHMNGAWTSDVSNVKLEDGKLFCTATFYRTNHAKTMDAMNQFMQGKNRELAEDFVNWIPHNVATGYVSDGGFHAYKAQSTLMSTTLMNCTAQKAWFQRLSSVFARAYRRRAFLFGYTSNGMEYDEFQDADKNIRDLVTEFQDKQDAYIEPSDDSEEEDDIEEEEEEEDSDDDESY